MKQFFFLLFCWPLSQSCLSSEEAPLGLEQILDTQVSVASFIDERDLDVASSVTRINEWEWQRLNARTLSDALESVPSLVNYASVGQGEAIAIRGFARNNSTRGTATFLDGIPINDFMIGSSQIDKSDIQLGVLDNIQVIRGPGSVLYGTDAFHGVLSLNTFHADRDITAISTRASSANYYRQSLKHSSKLSHHIRQHFAVGLSGQGDQHRPYQYTDPSDGLFKQSERALEYNAESLVYKWDIQASNTVSYSANVYANSQKTREFPSVSRFGGLSVGRDLDVNNAHSEFGLVSLKRTQAVGSDASMDMMLWQWQTHQSFLFNRSRFTTQDHIDQLISQRQRGVGWRLKQNQSRWLVDFNYRYQNVPENRADIVNADQSIFSTTFSPAKGMNRDIYSLGVALKETVLDGKVSFFGGVREDYYSDFGGNLSPRLGMIYYINPDHAVKLLYSEAFRAPVAAELAHASTALKPETIQTYELVWMHQKKHYKQEWAAFSSSWKDGIVLSPSASGVSYINHQQHASHGIESIHHLIWSRWHVKGSVAWVQSEDQTRDVEYVAFPDYIFNLNVSYFWPSQNIDFSFFNRVLWGFSEGPVVSSIPNPSKLPNFWRSDFYIKKAFRPQVDGFIFARNLWGRTNKVPSIFNAEGGYQEEPFSLGIGIDYQIE